jgi:hypothetical protein
MPNPEQLLQEIQSLPSDYQAEILDFVEFLKRKTRKHIPFTMLMSEAVLSKDWNTPEEDEAWADL